ncbi:uncharacterized protein LOC131852806 [Achroia grisella]|uniref:uncharacterized protein LOC131852806 n=1 Tax=Achroia grisella TaxID=688607 RepID=UPI0027D2B097|nr:uncharacterized protein LOC131852806 [Achroia grisella]
MAEPKRNVLPQEGTSNAGESFPTAPDSPGVGCPKYSGGDKLGHEWEDEEEVDAARREFVERLLDQMEAEAMEGLDSDFSGSSLSLDSEVGSDVAGTSTPLPQRRSQRKRRIVEKSKPEDDAPEIVFKTPGQKPATPSAARRTPVTKVGGSSAGPKKTTRGDNDPDLVQAKAELAAATQRDMELEAAAAVKVATPKPAKRPTTRRPSDEDAKRSDVLVSDIQDCALKVLDAVKKSGHLKGTVVKEIKDAVATIRAASESLAGRTASTECAALRRENSRLARDMADMRELMTGIREESAKYYVELRDLKKKTMGSAGQDMNELAMLKAERAEWEREIAATRNSYQEVLKRSNEDRLALTTALDELAAAKAALANQPHSAAMDMTSGAQSAEPRETPVITEGVEARIVRQIGDIFNARFERIEELVGRSQNPPPKRTTAAPRTPGAAKKGGSTAPVASTSRAGVSASQPAPSTSEQWTTVVRRGKRASAAKGQKSAPATQATTGGANTGQKKATTEAQSEATKRKRARKRQFRSPRSSAVVLTLQPGAAEAGSSYSSVLREAQQKIKLDALGITELGFRLAITGSRILEVPGPVEESGRKADALAAKLAEVIPAGVVSVSRPVKSAEIRILDLDDATTAAEVVAAVAREGDCAEASVKTGEIRRSPSGSGSIWARCPIGAVKRLVDAGKLRVGWTMARVRSLDPRPMRCYRCLLTGHVGQRCTAKEDRGGACFRCGQDGHKAASCTAPSPHCPYCAAAKKKADHRMGSTKGCRPPKMARVEEMEAETGPSPPTTGLAAADAGASAVT